MKERFRPSATAFAALAALLLYVAVRVAALPADLDVTRAVSHDSGYLGIVARNLLAGRGFVNDAHWLLFLNPPSLPMYYHNANPLYPTLTAAVMALTGTGPMAAGACLSILGTAIGAIGVFLIARRFGASERFAIANASVPLFLPPLFQVSFTVLPDAMLLGIILCGLAIVVHANVWWHWVLAGVVFGLAWLTRSTAALVVPAVGVWLIARHGWRATVRAGLLCAAGTLVIVSPWLVRNAKVRGGPFESDASFYLLIDYLSSRSGVTVDQLYRSVQPPPPIGEDVEGVLRTTASEAPQAVIRSVAAMAHSSVAAALVLLVALACGAWAAWRSQWHIEIGAALLVFVVTMGALAIRGEDLEPRYLVVCFTLLGLLLLAPFGLPGSRRRAWLQVPVVVYIAAFLVPQDLSIARTMRGVDPELQELRTAAISLDRAITDSSAVVTHLPYLFTLYTGRHSISPPYPGKAELLRIMERYHASHLILPDDAFAYYYRGGPGSLGPELTVDSGVPHFLVLQRRPSIP